MICGSLDKPLFAISQFGGLTNCNWLTCSMSPFIIFGVSGIFCRFYSIFDGKILLASDWGLHCLPLTQVRMELRISTADRGCNKLTFVAVWSFPVKWTVASIATIKVDAGAVIQTWTIVTFIYICKMCCKILGEWIYFQVCFFSNFPRENVLEL